MHCHECARSGVERVAVSLCRHCPVALCKEHLVAAFRSDRPYACDHHPERAFAPRPDAIRPAAGSTSRRPARTTRRP